MYVTEQALPLPLPDTTATDPKCFQKANLCKVARIHDHTTLFRFGNAPERFGAKPFVIGCTILTIKFPM